MTYINTHLPKYFARVGILIWVLIPFISTSQYYNKWPLYSGLIFDFSTCPPSFISAGRWINPSPLPSISDSSGRLVAYFTRDSLLDRNHKRIKKGYVCRLSEKKTGVFDFQQNSVMLPALDGNPDHYILIHSLDFLSVNYSNRTKLSYHRIDASKGLDSTVCLDSAGKVIYPVVFNKLTAVKDSADTGYWIVGRDKDTIYSFHYTTSGFSKPVTNYIPYNYNYRPEWPLGQLKSSNDGKTLIDLHNCWGFTEIYYMNFNTATGKIKDYKLLDTSLLTYPDYNKSVMLGKYLTFDDIAFSPNDSVFYAYTNHRNDSNEYDKTYIFQFNRYNPEIKNAFYFLMKGMGKHDILNKIFYKESLYGTANGIHYGMQLGADGKIYMVTHGSKESDTGNFFTVIQHPDRFGKDCDIQTNAFKIFLPEYYDTIHHEYKWPQTMLGLPFVMHNGQFVRFYVHHQCGNAVKLQNASHQNFINYVWYFGDGDSSTTYHATHTYAKAGKYLVKLKGITRSGYVAWSSDSIEIVKIQALFLIKDSMYCQHQHLTIADLSHTDSTNAEGKPYKKWDFGDGVVTDTITTKYIYHAYKNPGLYTLSLTYCNGFSTDTFTKNITVLPAINSGFSIDKTSGCIPLSVKAQQGQTQAAKHIFYFGDGSVDSSLSATHIYNVPGKYVLRQYIQSANGCINTDSALVKVYEGLRSNPKINNATYEDDEQIHIYWQKQNAATQYFLNMNNGSISSSKSFSGNDSVYKDSLFSLYPYAVTYRLAAMDSCNIILKSDTTTTLYLEGADLDGNNAYLSWSAYAGWQNGVSKYVVQRKDKNGSWFTITTLDSAGRNYSDAGFIDTSEFKTCYRVAAIRRDNTAVISNSNTVCLRYMPRIWLPNIFTPNGDPINGIYLPIGIGIEEFEMHIQSRDNGIIFSTKDIHQGWDGTYKGKHVPVGVYIAHIRIKTKDGNSFFKQNVTLVR